MSLRLAASLIFLGLLAGCGPQQRYASSEATYVRFQLEIAQHSGAVSRWYECFALEDAEYRQTCLSRTPGVRVARGPGLLCEEAAGPDLCRAFPQHAPEEDEMSGASTVDDDNAGGAIAGVFGSLLVGILSVFDSDDSEPEREPQRSARSEQGVRTR